MFKYGVRREIHMCESILINALLLQMTKKLFHSNPYFLSLDDVEGQSFWIFLFLHSYHVFQICNNFPVLYTLYIFSYF